MGGGGEKKRKEKKRKEKEEEKKTTPPEHIRKCTGISLFNAHVKLGKNKCKSIVAYVNINRYNEHILI
jgi:hypothetical protein